MIRIHSSTAGFANVHLIDDGHGVILVDAGWPGFAPRILKQVSGLGYQANDVRLILLTHVHVDHAGGASELRRLTGAPIAMHSGDLDKARAGEHLMPRGRGWAGVTSKWLFDRSGLSMKYDRFEPDVLIEEGQTLGDFGLEGYVIHTPGHTVGSITLALEDGMTVIGDALINLFKVGYPMYWEDPQAARESGRRIQALRPRVLYSGHGRPFGAEQLDRYLHAYAMKREQ